MGQGLTIILQCLYIDVLKCMKFYVDKLSFIVGISSEQIQCCANNIEPICVDKHAALPRLILN